MFIIKPMHKTEEQEKCEFPSEKGSVTAMKKSMKL